MPLRDAAAHFDEQTRRQEGRTSGAYKPIVTLDPAELKEIQERTEVFLSGDIDAVDDYISRKSLSLWQTLGVIAEKEVKGRNGLGAKLQAGKGWFEMAMKCREIVKAINARKNPKL